MRFIVYLIAAVSLSAQTFNSSNAGNLPSQVQWGFIGNLSIPSDTTPVYTPILGNNSNSGTATCVTAQACAAPFHAPIGQWCLELDDTQSLPLTFTVYHTVAGVWMASPLTVTVGTGGLQAEGTYCSVPGGGTVNLSGYSGPFESLAPSNGFDQIAVQIVSQQNSHSNVLTSISYVSPPPSFPVSVSPQTFNVLPQSANGRGFWPVDGTPLAIASGTSSPFVCDLMGVACSPIGGVSRLTQVPAMKYGRISGLCVYVKGTLATDIVVAMNVDGVASSLAASVPNGTAASTVCNSANYVDTNPSTLLDLEITNTGAGSLSGALIYVTFLF